MKNSILCVDDHSMILKATSDILLGNFDCQVSTAYNGIEALEVIKQRPINVAIIDINMPEMNGIELLRNIKKDYPHIKTLMLTQNDHHETINKCFQIGCDGYLTKSRASNKQLVEAIDLINKGKEYADPNAISALVKTIRKDIILDEPEIDFLKLMCTELTYSEIAKKIEMSPSAVEKKRQRIFEKINVKNRVGAVMWTIKNGFYDGLK
jgi:DNA-binding NarL/FixJ family response regulator